MGQADTEIRKPFEDSLQVLMLIVGVVFTIAWLILGIPGALALGVAAYFLGNVRMTSAARTSMQLINGLLAQYEGQRTIAPAAK